MEPQLPRPACRSRWPRSSGSRTAAASTTRSARCATSSSTTCCSCSPPRRWSRPSGGDPDTLKDAKRAVFRAMARRRPAPITSAASTTAIARSTASRRTRPPRRYVALRLEIDNWRWAGVPFFIRTGKHLAVTADRDCGCCSSTRRACTSSGTRHRRPAAEPDRVQDRPAHRDQDDPRRPARRPARRPTEIEFDMEFAREGGEGADPVRGAAARRADRRQHPLHPPGQRRGDAGGSSSRCSTHRRPCTPTRRARGGPTQADELVAGYGGWHGPWMPGRLAQSDSR